MPKPDSFKINTIRQMKRLSAIRNVRTVYIVEVFISIFKSIK